MQDRWYLKTRSRVLGPFTNEELATALQDGSATAESLVRRGVGGPFQPLREVLSELTQTARGSSEIASEILAKMDRSIVMGNPAIRGRVSWWESLVDAVGKIFSALFWPIQVAWNWLAVYIGRKTLAVLFLAGAVIFVLRLIPAFDPPLGQTHRELVSIWEETQDVTTEPVDTAVLDQFVNRTTPRLDGIADMLERSHERRLGYNIWALFQGRDDATEKARLDLLRVAKFDLPNLLRSPAQAGLREPLIEKQLNRAAEHLAAAGKSPYTTPEPFKRVAEVPTTPIGAQTTPTEWWGGPWVVTIVILDALLIIGGGVYWWHRKKTMA